MQVLGYKVVLDGSLSCCHPICVLWGWDLDFWMARTDSVCCSAVTIAVWGLAQASMKIVPWIALRNGSTYGSMIFLMLWSSCQFPWTTHCQAAFVWHMLIRRFDQILLSELTLFYLYFLSTYKSDRHENHISIHRYHDV